MTRPCWTASSLISYIGAGRWNGRLRRLSTRKSPLRMSALNAVASSVVAMRYRAPDARTFDNRLVASANERWKRTSRQSTTSAAGSGSVTASTHRNSRSGEPCRLRLSSMTDSTMSTPR